MEYTRYNGIYPLQMSCLLIQIRDISIALHDVTEADKNIRHFRKKIRAHLFN
jgi:hypothetical protein